MVLCQMRIQKAPYNSSLSDSILYKVRGGNYNLMPSACSYFSEVLGMSEILYNLILHTHTHTHHTTMHTFRQRFNMQIKMCQQVFMLFIKLGFMMLELDFFIFSQDIMQNFHLSLEIVFKMVAYSSQFQNLVTITLYLFGSIEMLLHTHLSKFVYPHFSKILFILFKLAF